MARLVIIFFPVQPPNLINSIDLFYESRYSHTEMKNPDFVRLAQAMGVHAIRCTSAQDLPEKMAEFLRYDGSRPVLLECLVERNEHVFPMVGVFLFFSFSASIRKGAYLFSPGPSRKSSP
jgi:hypothetical protein